MKEMFKLLDIQHVLNKGEPKGRTCVLNTDENFFKVLSGIGFKTLGLIQFILKVVERKEMPENTDGNSDIK